MRCRLPSLRSAFYRRACWESRVCLPEGVTSISLADTIDASF